jgi:hypothetical protein
MIKKTKIINWALALFLGVTSCLQASDPQTEDPGPVLVEGDVVKFIETLPKIASKLDALGKSFEAVQSPEQAEAMLANNEVQSIMQQHGWKPEEFFTKATTISMGFGLVKMQAELAKMPPEQRQMMEQMMQRQMPDLNLHPSDLAKLEPHAKALEAMFESL